MSVEQLEREPVDEIRKAFLIWEMDADRDKLKAEREKQNN